MDNIGYYNGYYNECNNECNNEYHNGYYNKYYNWYAMMDINNGYVIMDRIMVI